MIFYFFGFFPFPTEQAGMYFQVLTCMQRLQQRNPALVPEHLPKSEVSIKQQ